MPKKETPLWKNVLKTVRDFATINLGALALHIFNRLLEFSPFLFAVARIIEGAVYLLDVYVIILASVELVIYATKKFRDRDRDK